MKNMHLAAMQPIACNIGCLRAPMHKQSVWSSQQHLPQQHSRCRTCAGQMMRASVHQHNINTQPILATSRRHAALATAVLLQQLANQVAGCDAGQLQQQQQQLVPLTSPPIRSLVLADIQADYDRYAAKYDALDGGAASEALGFPELRRQLLQQASGDVLEVGVGTGLNLPFYDWSNLTSLAGVDVSPGMLGEAAARLHSDPSLKPATLESLSTNTSESGRGNRDSTGNDGGSNTAARVPVRLVQADVVQLPFPDASFDVVLDTFSLCVFGQPQAALAEMARVLRPGGRLLLVEHSRSDNPLLGAYMGATRIAVAPLSKGCDWAQDVPAMLQQLPGITIRSQQRHLAGTLVSAVATKQA